MFLKKPYEVNPFPVSDKVIFRNVDETLTLTVRADASQLVTGIRRIQLRLESMNEDTPEKERIDLARLFATTIFGEKQGEELCRFYGNEPLSILNACGIYFRERLGKKITKAQINNRK